ncbi:translation initiation factor IF-2, putative [Babesia ovata]|uniref:Translation initiation factor IF-2, putative n=1 Tax=Babesia ovata TaxID=189622 RepID=A0A2H6KD63_9APIC|nr:translation initiation factor IF-2, putative [Babesia ovata]GBE60927.1 translation initiation factor IF-2, putative [Babesia ovata]
MHHPAEVVVYEAGRVQGVGPVGDGLHELWALRIGDVAAKQRGQGLGMVLVVDGGGRAGAPGVLDDFEVVGLKMVPVGAVVMWLGEGGAQRRQLWRKLVKLIPEIVEERDKLPGGARRPPGEAGEVRGQCQQGIIAAAGGREDGEKDVASFVSCRQIFLCESHVDTALAADIARVEGICLELGVCGVSQKGLEWGLGDIIAILTILPTTM